MHPGIKIITGFKDEFIQTLLDEIHEEFQDYRHYDIGFGVLLKAMIFDIGEAVLQHKEFRDEIKFELKLIMNYLHMVREINLIRDLNASLFPMLLMGAAGNRTVVKQIILATHISVKAMLFITETYRAMIKNPRNQDPVHIAWLYAEMLDDLRMVNNRIIQIRRIENPDVVMEKMRQLSLLKHRKKNNIRRALGLPALEKIPDDPFRSLKSITVPAGEGFPIEREYFYRG